ncbi:MAG: TrpB-like pyridoxal phosphate-dependent enzyme [Candidatus Methylomirabilales bacterium]
MQANKVFLPEAELSWFWYNILADLPNPPPPPLHPETQDPLDLNELTPLFPKALIEQEVTREALIPIPGPVRQIYSLWRPTPLYRAKRLEDALETPAKIFYKYEGVSPAGSHKPNTAVAQAYYNKEEKVRRLTTETGAGQWGSALAFACRLLGLECTVYMVRVSHDQKPYRRSMMEVWGATVHPSPSPETEAGRKALAEDPNAPGSLGIAISEAVEDARRLEDTRYALGSVLNHVLLHQTVVGLEAIKQMELFEAFPDVIFGCCGGGSNFAGLAFPFLKEKLEGRSLRLVAVEPIACPTLTRGRYAYDFGDTARLTPLLKMHTLGHGFIPPAIHAGGLRYHGMAPLISALVDQGLIEAIAYPQRSVFEAAVTFARVEGILPAPEAAHAVRAVMDEAIRCRESGEGRTLLFNLSGHGHFDLSAYDRYLKGEMEDHVPSPAELERSLASLSGVR